MFECSGSPKAWDTITACRDRAARSWWSVFRSTPIAFDISGLSTKEIRIESVFRYAHQYDRAIALIASGKVDLKPLITETFPFEKSIAAFERAAEGRPADVKLQI